MNRLVRFLKPLLILAVFGIAVWLLFKQLHNYDMAKLWEDVKATQPRQIFLAIVLTALNYVVLFGYDFLAIRYIGQHVPIGKLIVASFCGHAFSFNLGSLFGGASVRYRFYSTWGFKPSEIAQLIAVLGVTFWLGVLALAGVVFLVSPFEMPKTAEWERLQFTWSSLIHVFGATLMAGAAIYGAACLCRRHCPRRHETIALLGCLGIGALLLLPWVSTFQWARNPVNDVRPLGAILLSLVVGYLVLSIFRREPLRLAGWELPLPPPSVSIGQIVVSCADLMVAAWVFHVLLPQNVEVGYLHFLGVFLLGMVTAAFTHVPAGLGVFEAIVLFFTPVAPGQDIGVVLAPVVVFRGVYYLLPLIVATLTIVAREIRLGHAYFRKKSRLQEAPRNSNAAKGQAANGTPPPKEA
jgi:uncharacterized membrane protein YbhN (UPF0104 family)